MVVEGHARKSKLFHEDKGKIRREGTRSGTELVPNLLVRLSLSTAVTLAAGI